MIKIKMNSFFKIILLAISTNCLLYNRNTWNLSITPYEEIESVSYLDSSKFIQQTKDTKKRKNVVTYYYGDELIRQKILWKGKEDYNIILRGNALIIHEKTKIYAPEIIIDPDNNGKINGNLLVVEESQGLYLYAKGGIYNRDEEYIKISNNPYMKLINNDEEIIITTTEILRDISGKKIIFKNYIKMYGKDWFISADESIYYDETKQFILQTYPVLMGKDIYLTAKNIIYKSDEQKVLIEDQPIIFNYIKTEVEEKNNKDNKQDIAESQNQNLKRLNQQLPVNKEKKYDSRKQNKEEKEVMTIYTDRIEYNLKEKKGKLQGNILMVSKTKKIQGEEFLISGSGLEKIESYKKVIIEDKKENFYLESQYMMYDIKNKYLYLKNNPIIRIFEKENQNQIKEELSAKIIERDFNKEITIAKGDVFFKRGKEKAFSEYAYIDEKKETMLLTGNPLIKRGDTEIQCKKITIFKNKIEFEREFEAKIY